jgi:hypothetical protein
MFKNKKCSDFKNVRIWNVRIWKTSKFKKNQKFKKYIKIDQKDKKNRTEKPIRKRTHKQPLNNQKPQKPGENMINPVEYDAAGKNLR